MTGTADLSLVPLSMLQRVEVYRGNAPADADRLGIGGAVFFEPLLPHGTRVSAGFGAGSFGELSMRVAGSFGDERGGGMVALQRQSATNDYAYVNTFGVTKLRHNADFAAYDLWSIARYPLAGGSVTVIASGFVRDQGVSSFALDPASVARAHTERWLGASPGGGPVPIERERPLPRRDPDCGDRHPPALRTRGFRTASSTSALPRSRHRARGSPKKRASATG